MSLAESIAAKERAKADNYHWNPRYAAELEERKARRANLPLRLNSAAIHETKNLDDSDVARENQTADRPSQFIPTPFKHRDLATVPRRQFVYGRHYIRDFLSATVSQSGVGKSALAIAEAVAMTTGLNLLGVQPPKPLRVWYWNGEDPAEEIQRRVEAACLHFK